MIKRYLQFINEAMSDDLKNPFLDNDLTSLEDLHKRIKNHAGEMNKSMSIKIDIEKDDKGISKITLTSKNNDNKIEITNNGNTDDFYHLDINGNKEEDQASEYILMYIDKYFTIEDYK
jgi:hypothetical protein